LTNKQGYCEQYASAMAVMLRSLNIPTRVVVGFTQGVRQADGSYLVTSHDAHAWVEVKFENNGWVRFDPTPAVGGQGGQQGFTESAGAAAKPTSASTVAPLTGAGNRVAPDPTTVVSQPSAAPTQVAGSGAGGSSIGWVRVAVALLLAIALLFGLLMIPNLVRAGRRKRRLALIRSGVPGSATAAWTEIEDTATDHGILPQAAESARVTANRLARRAHLEMTDRGRLRGVVVAAEKEWYGGPTQPVTIQPIIGSSHPPAGPKASDDAGARGATMVVDRPATDTTGGAELAAAVTAVIRGLQENSKLTLGERIVPRSLRRGRR